jgi:dTDP-4-dehydrorhamnose 3,5-epimerase-like enzyme
MKNCRIINFKKIGNSDVGFLTALEGNKEIPFDIKRIYYIYNVPNEIERGCHAHKRLEQVLVCLNMSVKIKLDDGNKKKIIELNSPNKGLYIGPGVWREMYDFSQNSVLLVLASDYYDESDYVRDYITFREFIKKKNLYSS